jgi:hypothetical protein
MGGLLELEVGIMVPVKPERVGSISTVCVRILNPVEIRGECQLDLGSGTVRVNRSASQGPKERMKLKVDDVYHYHTYASKHQQASLEQDDPN